MSARSATTGPGRPVRTCATTACSAGRSTSSPSPKPPSVSATNALVSRSSKLSSGWRCRCRRHSTTSSMTDSAPSTSPWLPRRARTEAGSAGALGLDVRRVPPAPRDLRQPPDERLLRAGGQPRQIGEREQQVVQRDRRLQRVAEQPERVDVAALLERERRLEE